MLFSRNYFYLGLRGYLRFAFSVEGLSLVCMNLNAFIDSVAIAIITLISNCLPNYSIADSNSSY